MRYTEYHAGKAVIKDKNKLADAMEKLARLEEEEESGGWIPCSEKFPEFKSLGSTGSIDHYETHLVLIQTKRGEMFVAWCHKTVYECEKYDDDYYWYSSGTGGRRMRIMSKVVAWMPLPEPYKEEKQNDK